ncbi:type II secretion system protein [Chitinibacter fontanus]|uniref:Type II secretion system protein n=1 Tax=Chitinibacter fontanus TaxID=1737446 RepID=A0A7D5ZDV5_9NEIS|nr:prepilin-type N-terminal cleavage/methylation domain-containing protein [Chitinibacter fontanus]QLI81766.1 type II secretion system protein [Chitinibacter fontanus]
MVNKLAQQGFTLVELIFTLAIMSILLALAVPLSSRWSDDAQVRKAKATMERGYQQAKAIALRNPTGQTDTTIASASMVIANNILLVCNGQPDDCDAASAKWQEALPGKTFIVTGSTCSANAALEIGINSRGLRNDATSYKVCQGNSYETVEL